MNGKKSVKRKLRFKDTLLNKTSKLKQTGLGGLSRKTKILVIAGSIALLSLNTVIPLLSFNGHYIIDDLLVDHIETVKPLPKVEIGRIYKITPVDNLPIFKSAESAIDFVKKIPYDVWEDNPKSVLETNKGNCLGKARLLYFIGKKYKYDFKFYKTENHIRLDYGGDIIELT